MTRTYDCRDPHEWAKGVAAAVDAVKRGSLVVLPTDTVYGIGADAFSSSAVSSLLSAKQRGRDMPVPVLVGSWRTIDGLVSSVSSQARDLIEAFWPGGLTLIVEHAPSLTWDLGDADGTVAVRMPLHPVALELLEATGPMAVSSANVSGKPAAKTIDEARDQLGWLVDIYLDAGEGGDVASTIVDLTGEVPELVRLGALSLTDLRSVVPNISAAGFEEAEDSEEITDSEETADSESAGDADAADETRESIELTEGAQPEDATEPEEAANAADVAEATDADDTADSAEDKAADEAVAAPDEGPGAESVNLEKA